MFHRIVRAGLAFAMALPVLAFGPDDPRPVRLVLKPGSQVTIEGTSNVHDWSCTTSAIVADIRARAEDEAMPRSVDFVSVEIPVARIACKNDKMNENMARALRAEAHPRIAFRTTGARTLSIPDAAGRISATFRGTLTVAGVTKPVDLVVQARAHEDGTIRITGSKPFLMTQFDIDPPTAMLGMMKTGNRVTVHFDLVASTADIAAAGGVHPTAR